MLSRTGALTRSIPSFLLRQYCLGKEATVAQLNLLREAISLVSPEVLSHRLGLVAARHSFGKVRFQVPCHYIQAANDRLVPEKYASWFQRRFDSCELEILKGPHFLLQARPNESAQIVARTVRILTGGRNPTAPTSNATLPGC
jgi:pimeloyl-ACP methyl ester carboxylesterase